jgi:hypothetical protein
VSKWTHGLLVVSLVFALGAKIDRLQPVEQDHFNALRVWMDDKAQKAYLKNKTREERDAFLQEHGFWDRFYQYDEDRREQILAGEVKQGWSYDQAYMAWGQPFQKQRLTARRAARSELLVYRFEVMSDGAIMVWQPGSKATHKAVDKYQIELVVDDEKITEFRRKEEWE